MIGFTSNYPIVVAKLNAVPAAMRAGLLRSMRRGLEMIRTMSQREYLSGPRPSRLGVVTTRLRNSIATDVRDDGADITGRIGTNVAYGAYHEFGFRGTVNVRAHQRVVSVLKGGRRISTNTLRGAIREKGTRTIVGYKRSTADGLASKPGLVGNVVTVSAHKRTLHYAGRPFLRPAIMRCESKIAAMVDAELRDQVRRNQSGQSA